MEVEEAAEAAATRPHRRRRRPHRDPAQSPPTGPCGPRRPPPVPPPGHRAVSLWALAAYQAPYLAPLYATALSDLRPPSHVARRRPAPAACDYSSAATLGRWARRVSYLWHSDLPAARSLAHRSLAATLPLDVRLCLQRGDSAFIIFLARGARPSHRGPAGPLTLRPHIATLLMNPSTDDDLDQHCTSTAPPTDV